MLDLEKVPGVAYKNVLNEFDSIFYFVLILILCVCGGGGRGVKSLSVTRINLVVTWKVRPQMGIIS